MVTTTKESSRLRRILAQPEHAPSIRKSHVITCTFGRCSVNSVNSVNSVISVNSVRPNNRWYEGAPALLEQIRSRGLDELFSTEEAINKQTVATILKYLRSPEGEGKPTPVDKLRLVIVFYLSSQDNAVSKDDVAELEAELKKQGADIAAFEYVRRLREISRMIVPSAGAATPIPGTLGGAGSGGGGGELFKGFSSLGNRVRIFSPVAHSLETHARG